MTAFYWSKAAPGLYYLYDLPKPTDGRIGRPFRGKVSHLGAGRYLLSVPDGPHTALAGKFSFMGCFTPKTAIADLERWLRASNPAATFTRENF